ncbi:MAG TPA: LPS assembly protein LptD [Rhizomicrobium sp.]|jgi:LPS-assembly protein|nr:LPS assembly protein LptD [Rhizomicrobium sp.]HEX4534747.1 LPS assembly protein LptD [Rhizomicrobium sp.]
MTGGRLKSLLRAGCAALVLGALPPAAHAANSILGKASNMLLRADTVDYDINNNVVTAHGHIEIDYNDRILTADQVSYDQNSDKVTASGHVVVVAPDGNVAFANSVVLTDNMRDGVLRGFAALIGKNGRLGAASAQRVAGVQTIADRGVYTNCKICRQKGERNPLWQVKAFHVVYNEVKHRIVFHDATMELFGVPVFYTPYFSVPDPTVKHESGILTPSVGHSSLLGYSVQLPVYIALSDSQDATLAPSYYSQGGELLESEYRQRWANGGMWLQATVANTPYGGLSGHENTWYSSLFGSGRIALTDTWSLDFDVQLTSNDTYLKRYSLSTLDRLVSDLSLTRESGRSRFAITGYFFQGLRATDVGSTIPLAIPVIEYTYIPLHDWLGGQFRFDLNGNSVTRNVGPDAQRVTAEARWRLPLITADGQLITLQADARGDAYHIDNNSLIEDPTVPLQSRYLERGLPYVALDWRWPFLAAGKPGHSFVIEPIAQAIAAPYGGNPDGIPNDDSESFEFDDNNLLTFDRFPGYDLVESGPRANLGLHAIAYFPTGSIEALAGQTFRPRPDPVFATDSGLRGTTSDLVGLVTVKFPPYFSLAQRVDVDQSTGELLRNEVYFTGTYKNSALEVSYVRLPPQPVTLGLDTREEITAEAVLGLIDHWQLYAAGQRDLESDQMIESDFGIGYNDECLGISIAYRRQFTRDRDVPPSTDVLLSVKLKTNDDVEQPTDLFPHHIFTAP